MHTTYMCTYTQQDTANTRYLGVEEGVVGKVDEDLSRASVFSRGGKSDAAAGVALLGGIVHDVGAGFVHLVDLTE